MGQVSMSIQAIVTEIYYISNHVGGCVSVTHSPPVKLTTPLLPSFAVHLILLGDRESPQSISVCEKRNSSRIKINYVELPSLRVSFIHGVPHTKWWPVECPSTTTARSQIQARAKSTFQGVKPEPRSDRQLRNRPNWDTEVTIRNIHHRTAEESSRGKGLSFKVKLDWVLML